MATQFIKTKVPVVETQGYTLQDIRGILTEEVELLRHGQSNPARVYAIAHAMGKQLQAVHLEIQTNRLAGSVPDRARLLDAQSFTTPDHNE